MVIQLFFFCSQIFLTLLASFAECLSDHGFFYFDGPDDLLANYENVTREQRWTGAPLENFHWNNRTAKTLIVHDFGGGYLPYEGDYCEILQNTTRPCFVSRDDETTVCEKPIFNLGQKLPKKRTPVENWVEPYLFAHWWYIDVFVYFSHRYVTVPPRSWIDEAHRHGVLVLGTFIVEFSRGKAISDRLLGNETELNATVEAMVELATKYNFDGWLINVENNITASLLPRLGQFLDGVRYGLRERHPLGDRTMLVWYDAVLNNGTQSYENELNERNDAWFAHSDAFYVNYQWKVGNLTNTAKHLATLGRPHTDVFVGVDIWARNAIGGWLTPKALSTIQDFGFSVALFAPGWLTEHFSGTRCLFAHSARFWHSLRPFFNPERRLRARHFASKFQTGLVADFQRNCWVGVEMERASSLEGGIQPHFFNLPMDVWRDDIVCGEGLELEPTDDGGVWSDYRVFDCAIPLFREDSYIAIRINSSTPVDISITFSMAPIELSLARIPYLERTIRLNTTSSKENKGGKLLETAFGKWSNHSIPIPRGVKQITRLTIFNPKQGKFLDDGCFFQRKNSNIYEFIFDIFP